ncbi:hypothetical protein [Marinobacter caseinilyticus]|uniref:hypothetical protein n=1 Tax=Marinobacter caseinilyticus TaxID=2692195 RepID=UPI00140DDC55|nr:hypothetical protein [Marinobacter caseinilyticus]
MLKRISLVFFGDGVAKALNLAATLYILKMLNVSDYANFTILFASVMLSYQSVCGVFERFYISDYKNFNDIYFTASLMLGTPVLIIGYSYLNYANYEIVVEFFLIGYIFFFLFQSLRIFYQKAEFFKSFVITDFIRNIVWLSFLLVFWLLNLNLSFNLVALSFVASAAISVIFIFLFGMKNINVPKIYISPSLIKQSLFYLKDRNELFLYALAAGFFPYIPVVASMLLSSENVVASYGAAMRFQAIFSMCIYSLHVVFLPRIVGLNSKEAIALLKSFYRKLPYLIIGMFVVAFIVINLIDILDLDKFQGLKTCFLFFAGCSILSMSSTPAASYLLSNKKYRVLFSAMGLGLLVVIILVPLMLMVSEFYGILGALLIAYLAICVFLLIGASQVIHENINN